MTGEQTFCMGAEVLCDCESHEQLPERQELTGIIFIRGGLTWAEAEARADAAMAAGFRRRRNVEPCPGCRSGEAHMCGDDASEPPDCDATTDVAPDGLLWCTRAAGHAGPHQHGDLAWGNSATTLDIRRQGFHTGWYAARQQPGIAAATHSPSYPKEES